MRIGNALVLTTGFLLVAGNHGFVGRVLAADAAPSPAPTVGELMVRDLEGIPDKEAVMMTVTYSPGGASLPHRHDAQVFVYVLEGTLTMQVDGSPPVTLGPGQTFYEGTADVHRVSANASSTQSAKILVFMVKSKGRPASRAIAPKESP